MLKEEKRFSFSNKTASPSLKEKKDAFLRTIRSKNPKSMNKYKRVAVSPIRYAGGKTLAVGHVIELLPNNIKRVISPFFGGGSIEIAMSKFLDLEVIGYDIFDILMNYWKYQIENPKLLYEELKKLKPTKEQFEKIRKILNKVWKKEITLDPLTLAVYFVYNFNLSYGPGFMGWSSNIYLKEDRYKKMIEKIRDFKPGKLKTGCADFRKILKKYPNDFMYLDPPYYIGPDSKMFKGIYPMRNIPIHHNGFPHEVLRDMLKQHKGGFILSYNDCPTIREYYKEFKQFFPKWQYTMGQGETRIGKNRKENGTESNIKGSHEIIIFCPPRETEDDDFMKGEKIELPKNETPIVLIGDVLDRLKDIPDKSINVIVTSPPYWGQRDYETEGQIGNEKTPEEYIKKMLDVADELKRVLTDDGAYFLNVGDKYVKKNLQMIPFKLAIEMQKKGWTIRNVLIWRKTNAMPSSIKDRFSNVYEPIFLFVKSPDNYLTSEYYFDLDSVRIAHKTNGDTNHKSELPLTLSIEEYDKWKDKITSNGKNGYNGKFKNTNKINLGASPGARMSVNGEFYSKQRKHKIDSNAELEIIKFIKEYRDQKGISSKEIDKIFGYKDTAGHWFRTDKGGRCLPKPEDWFKLKEILEIKEDKYDKIMTEEHYVLQTVKPHELGKNPGDVWDFATGKLQDSHFAIFPEELPRRAILSCCPKNGIVLDPFVGSGTTLKVAKELNRKSIGIEIQKNYLEIIRKRCGGIQVL